jgi:hypothetical protein
LSDLPPIAAPAGEATPPAPAVQPVVQPAPAPAPEVAPAPAATPAATPTEPPALKPHTDTPTLLGDVKAAEQADPVKPAEQPKPAEGAPEQPKPPETPTEPAPEAFTYEFKFPEDVQAPAEAIEAARTIFRENGIKPDVAQRLVDRHIAEVQRERAGMVQAQHDAFAKMREDWRGQVMSDPELGGAGHRTAMAAIARMRDLLVPESDRAAFNEFLASTGGGDHPALLRAFYRAARFMDSRPDTTPTNILPPPDLGRNPNKGGLARLYTTMNGGN